MTNRTQFNPFFVEETNKKTYEAFTHVPLGLVGFIRSSPTFAFNIKLTSIP